MRIIEHQKQQEEYEKLNARKPRKYWVRPWLLRRELYGQYDTLMHELAAEDVQGYVAFQRVCPELFQELLAKIGPRIEKRTTKMRQPISPEVRLAITLRYLATGKQLLPKYFLCLILN